MENQETVITTPQTNTEALPKTEGAETPQEPNGEQKDSGIPNPEGTPDKKEGEKEAKPEVPEKYDFKMPDGFQADETSLNSFSTLAKELKLSQEGAQKLVEYAAQWSKGQYEKTVQDWDAKRADWVKSIKEDTEFGGVKFDENAERAKRVYGKLATPELTKFLEDTGFGDHPELFKMMVKIDKMIGETPFVEGDAKPDKKDLTQAQRLYADQK